MSNRKPVVLSVDRFDMGSGIGHYWVKFKVMGEKTDFVNDDQSFTTVEGANEFIEKRIREKYNDKDYELIVEDYTDHVYSYEGD